MAALSVALSPQPARGVLIHGCNLNTETFNMIVFGNKERLGRVPTGIEEAIHRNAAFIFWGGGSSQTSDGTIEADYIFEQAVGVKLLDLATHVKKDCDDLSKFLREVSFRDTVSVNTKQEIATATRECLARGIRELTLISSPTHVPRCLQEACIFKEHNPDVPLTIYARPSQTCFADSTAADVAIFEPPHREDTPKVKINQTMREIYPILKDFEVAVAFDLELAKLIAEFKAKLRKA